MQHERSALCRRADLRIPVAALRNHRTHREADGAQDAKAEFLHEKVCASKFTQTAIQSSLARLLKQDIGLYALLFILLSEEVVGPQGNAGEC